MPVMAYVMASLMICAGVYLLIGVRRSFGPVRFPFALALSLSAILCGAACLYFTNPLYCVLGMGILFFGSFVVRKLPRRPQQQVPPLTRR